MKTASGASAIFRYSTGAVVKTNPKSWFGIQKPTVTKSSVGEMNGRLWQGISNFYFPKGAEAEKKWGVETNMAIVGIKGTSFVLEASDTGTNLQVLEGSVEYTHKSTGKSATVEAGRLLVDTYYQVSPLMAEFIAEHEDMRAFVREALLNPVVFVLDRSRDTWNN